MGRLLWDEMAHSLCSRSPHGETVVARRAQLRVNHLIPLFWGVGGEEGAVGGDGVEGVSLLLPHPHIGMCEVDGRGEEPNQPMTLRRGGKRRGGAPSMCASESLRPYFLIRWGGISAGSIVQFGVEFAHEYQ